jgi:hypothetical protein
MAQRSSSPLERLALAATIDGVLGRYGWLMKERMALSQRLAIEWESATSSTLYHACTDNHLSRRAADNVEP